MDSVEENKSSFWTGFFIGAAIGAGAGLVLAPAPGRETRERLRGATQQVMGQVSQLPGGVQQTLQGATERSRQYVQDVRGRVSTAVQAGREAARSKREELQAEVAAATSTDG